MKKTDHGMRYGINEYGFIVSRLFNKDYPIPAGWVKSPWLLIRPKYHQRKAA